MKTKYKIQINLINKSKYKADFDLIMDLTAEKILLLIFANNFSDGIENFLLEQKNHINEKDDIYEIEITLTNCIDGYSIRNISNSLDLINMKNSRLYKPILMLISKCFETLENHE